MIRPKDKRRASFALVLILSFIALLSVVALAFFSYSILQRQISNSSANMERAELFAQGALDTTVGDLQQEIVDGSTSTTVTASSGPPAITCTLYTPTPPTVSSGYTGLYPSMVPYLVNCATNGSVSTTAAALPNLAKESISGQPFYPNAWPYAAAGSSRAANSLTTTASLNGRLISLARWNEPLLLPRKNPGLTSTDLTPTNSFTTPNWIYVDTTGKNPTTFPPATSPQIVGRYAYCIYNEGGLLDMNVAGYPVAASPSQADLAAAAHKTGTSFADLTSFIDPTTSTNYLSSTQVEQILGWRNYATTQPSGTLPNFTYSAGSVTNYFQNVVASSAGFVTTANTSVYGSGNQSDQKFTSRQQLIDFLTQSIGASRDALQYFGTFSRTLDQPSVWPDSTRPAVVGLAAAPAMSTANPGVAAAFFSNANAVGGNNAYSLDNSINSAFPQVLVTSSFTRNDGSTAVVGEPLVKKRFGLNRLAWITYLGPIADDNGNLNNSPSSSLYKAANASAFTTIINSLENTYGISAAFLAQGGPTNIKAYFGLTWGTYEIYNYASSTITTSTTPCWTYNHGAFAGPIARLSEVQGQGREPDFFELLKAAIPVGCLGKGAATDHTIGSSAPQPCWVDVNQYDVDTNTDFQIFQIGANIEDQFDTDSFPTHLQYVGVSTAGQTSLPWDFYGDENLPYLYRARTIAIDNNIGQYTAQIGPPQILADKDNALLLPEVWNPHDPNSNNNNTNSGYMGPTSFRFVLSQGSTAAASSSTPVPGTTAVYAVGQCRLYMVTSNVPTQLEPPGQNLQPANQGSPVTLDPNPPSTSGNGTEIDFSVPLPSSQTIPVTNYYYEPLFLGGLQNGVHSIGSAGSGNTLGAFSNNEDKLTASQSNPNYYGGVYLGYFKNIWKDNESLQSGWTNLSPQPTNTTLFPLQPLQNASYSSYNPATADQVTVFPSVSGNLSQTVPFAVDYILQYQDSASNWVTYQDDTSTIPAPGESSTSKAAYNSSNTNYVGPQVIDISAQTSWPLNSNPGSECNSGASISWMDPRTSRFGAFISSRKLKASSVGLQSMSDYYWGESDQPALKYGQGFDQALPGTGLPSSTYSKMNSAASVIGWYPGNWTVSPNSLPSGSANSVFVPGYYAENMTTNRPVGSSGATGNYFADPDGVVRRGMAAYTAATPANTIGLPLALLSSSPPTPAAQTQSRPFILNRPFRSVAELGYTFSGTPWRNLDFFTPESGYASLLDVFCVSETSDSSARVAGKVDLNTRQVPVLNALLSGTGSQGNAYKDEVNAGQSGTTASLSSTEIAAIAQALVNRTTATTTSGEGPLRNISELVGKWNKAVTASGAVAPFNIDGSRSYLGFSSDPINGNDLTGVFSDASTANIQRLRESAMRALSSAGQTRVWNLMIDLIAQTGRYKTGETNFDNFVVDGERRYWLHVAIDRFTGKVIDEQLEQVEE